MGELSSEVSRRMWLGTVYAKQGPSTVQTKAIPGILDSSINGKALGPVEFIVGHLVGVRGHSKIAHR